MSALVPLLVLLAASPARSVTHPKARAETPVKRAASPASDVTPPKSAALDDVTAQLATPGTQAAGTQAAGTQAAGTQAAGTQAAGTQAAGTHAAGTQAAGTQAAGTQAAGTQAAGTQAAGTHAAGTQAAGAQAAGTHAAGTQAAGTHAAGTQAAGTHAAGTQAAGTRASTATTADESLAGALLARASHATTTKTHVEASSGSRLLADASASTEDVASPRKVIQADTAEPGAGGLAPEPVPDVAPTAPPTPAAESAHVGRFAFGSYGRVSIGSDLLGQLGRNANVVAHGPRLIEDPYAELELRREDEWGAVKSRMVATMAFFPPFFHFSGDMAQNVGLRNLYFEAQVGDRFSAWAGSRMYRGDDIYLLNFWPLDNLNTIGGGASIKLTDDTTLKVHAGMQRLDNATTTYQYQVVQSDNPLGVGSVSVARLNRPRIIESVKLSHELHLGAIGARVSAYAEAHQLGAGVERNMTTGDETGLPADWGVLGGAQLSVWGEGTRFAHLWVRHARGLAAYDALEAPVTFNNSLTTQGANSTRFALAGGWDTAHLGVLVGGYVDLMRDAGVSQVSAQKYDEGSLSVRGQWYATKYFGLALEGSYQRRTYGLVDEATGQRRSGGVTQLGVMPYFAPLGQGLFARPQLRLVYALSLRDAGARSFYAADDVFSQRGVEHYVGISVEWWFNSSTYPVR